MSARFSWLPGADALIAAASAPTIAQVATACLARVKSSHRVGFGWRTGNLANSYTATPEGPGAWAVGTTVTYAPFVEYGTKFMPAQAHLRNAAAETAAAFPGVQYVGGTG